MDKQEHIYLNYYSDLNIYFIKLFKKYDDDICFTIMNFIHSILESIWSITFINKRN